jgi:hypothetical protein
MDESNCVRLGELLVMVGGSHSVGAQDTVPDLEWQRFDAIWVTFGGWRRQAEDLFIFSATENSSAFAWYVFIRRFWIPDAPE